MICSAVLIQYTRVTNRQTELAWHMHYSIYDVARKNILSTSIREYECQQIAVTQHFSAVVLVMPLLYYLTTVEKFKLNLYNRYQLYCERYGTICNHRQKEVIREGFKRMFRQ